MTTKRTNPDFLNGVPELLILSLLARRPMYGYELVQAIRQSTQGTLEFGEGCVYPVLHRLGGGGAFGQPTGDGRRPQPRGLSGHGQRLEAFCQHGDSMAADRRRGRTCPARRRAWQTCPGLTKC